MKVFISSTYEDLKSYVDATKTVFRELGVGFDQFKDWESTGRPTVSECKERVLACDALIVIVGSTYGWVPTVDEGGDGATSITRLEVRWAREKPMPVLPFFLEEIESTSKYTGEKSEDSRRLAEFVSELGESLGKPVDSLENFTRALRKSLELLCNNLNVSYLPSKVGDKVQGFYKEFRDREKVRAALITTLTSTGYRGASIVGKGGLGKSALANYMIDYLRENGWVDAVIYFNASANSPITGFELFMSTMEASGQSKSAFEGSWSSLQKNEERLIEVLLDVCRDRRLLLLFDSFEHNLQEKGRIRAPTIAAFVDAFLLSSHASILLITTRQPPLLSTDARKYLKEVPLNKGLPVADGVSLLRNLLPEGNKASQESLEAVVRAVQGIPFALERATELAEEDRLSKLASADVYEDLIDQFVQYAYSTLSAAAQMVIQARSIFDDPVPAMALSFVLEPFLKASEVDLAIVELGRSGFLFRVGSEGLLGIHEFDQESSYRSIGEHGPLNRRFLHRRAADYFAGQCEDRQDFFEWTSYDEVVSDISRCEHLIKAGEPVAAASALSLSKVEFLNWIGHVDLVRKLFQDLDVGEDPTPALLVKQFALADAFVVTGPFEEAIPRMKEVVKLAGSLGNEPAELSAMYELGLAYRYSGQVAEARKIMEETVDRERRRGESKILVFRLYGYGMACTYAGDYLSAIQAGREQIRYGRQTGISYFVGRGSSSLCLTYYLIGRLEDAIRYAQAVTDEFSNTAGEYMVGFAENVLGMALYGLGKLDESIAAFERARMIGRRTAQLRVEGLVATNLAWIAYERGNNDEATARIAEAISLFELMSTDDLDLVHRLREAIEYSITGEQGPEIKALLEIIRSTYVNPDLIHRTVAADRILLFPDLLRPSTKSEVERFLNESRQKNAAINVQLERDERV